MSNNTNSQLHRDDASKVETNEISNIVLEVKLESILSEVKSEESVADIILASKIESELESLGFQRVH